VFKVLLIDCCASLDRHFVEKVSNKSKMFQKKTFVLNVEFKLNVLLDGI
jgi:hypothetical protein